MHESLGSLKNTSIGNSLDALKEVLRPEINLAIWQREPLSAQLAIDELLSSSFEELQFLYNRTQPLELIGAFLDETAELKASDSIALWEDVMRLSEQMLQLSNDQEIGIRLERVTHDNCSSFHADHLSLRLLCTYWGEATQWLENDNADRSGLGQNSNDLVVKDWSRVHGMQASWVGVFKGENFPENRGQGVVHRSPEVVGKKNADRLLLRIDTVENFEVKNEY